MAMLQCDVCGGKLKGKPGGIYECEFCGVEYDIAWAKAKIQEIKGTVQVEGTVEVVGSVKVDGAVKVEGSVSIESLLKRAKLALEDEDWHTADECCNKILDIDPENAQAYLGRLMSQLKVGNLDALADQKKPFDNNDNYKKAYRFADMPLRTLLEGHLHTIKERNKKEQLALEQKKQQEQLAREARLSAAKEKLSLIRNKTQQVQHILSTGFGYAIGVQIDGTVISVGVDSHKPSGTDVWENIIAVSAACRFVVGLKANGTVVAAGDNENGQCNVDQWKNIIAVSAGGSHAVGLMSDGTVVATEYLDSKYNEHLGQCDVADWKDIVAISAGDRHTVGLKSDGTVVSTKMLKYDHGESDVADWKDIVAVSAGYGFTVGLRSNGTVVLTKDNSRHNYYEAESWEDIVAISAGMDHVVGIRSDGTVIATKPYIYHSYGKYHDSGKCDTKDWVDIVAVDAGEQNTIGLRTDGTVVMVGYGKEENNSYLRNWKLFKNLENYELERKISMEEKRQEEEAKRIAVQRRNAGLCQHCGGELKGLFSKKCVSCGKPKDY
jgi:alpha-tubulin suppressor-like RCC1 family protein